MNSYHWPRAFLILLATCVVVTLISLPASAACKSESKHHKHQMPSYAELDANDDGAVSAEEFYTFRGKRMAERAEAGGKMKNAENAPAFEDLDLDGDGNLSADEFAKHQAECPMKGKHKNKAEESES
jgi:hypothetical protein